MLVIPLKSDVVTKYSKPSADHKTAVPKLTTTTTSTRKRSQVYLGRPYSEVENLVRWVSEPKNSAHITLPTLSFRPPGVVCLRTFCLCVPVEWAIGGGKVVTTTLLNVLRFGSRVTRSDSPTSFSVCLRPVWTYKKKEEEPCLKQMNV